jgi:hypothetical protein
LKKIPDTTSFFKIVVEKKGNYYATTFFEKITSNKEALRNERDKGKNCIIKS